MTENSTTNKKTLPGAIVGATVNRLTPGVPEFLLAMNIVTPLIRRQMENPSFDARAYLIKAIQSAHKIASVALEGATINRYLMGNITNAVVKSGLIDADNQAAMQVAVAHVFSGKEDAVSIMVSELADASSTHYIDDGVDRILILRSALLSNSSEIISDIHQFSFWMDKSLVMKSILHAVGDLAVKFAKDDLLALTPRERAMLLQSLVARSANIVGQSYRAVAYAEMESVRKESNPAAKQQIRQEAGKSYLSKIMQMSDAKMQESVDMALSFCRTDIVSICDIKANV